MIAEYPRFSELTIDERPELHPRFKTLTEGVSEFTFANIYLFRDAHSYKISRLGAGHGPEGSYVVAGNDDGKSFFMLPFGLPQRSLLEELFERFGSMKAIPESQIVALKGMGYETMEDRDGFDYLYLKSDLAALQGRAFHKKKNLVNAFINNYTYVGKPLLEEYKPHALDVLDSWCAQQSAEGDYTAAREALEMSETLSLCGGVYYVDGTPAGYTLGEEVSGGTTYLIHFEKAVPGF